MEKATRALEGALCAPDTLKNSSISFFLNCARSFGYEAKDELPRECYA